MRFVAEPISNLRLQRFHRWAMLWLKWFAAFLDAAGAFAPISSQVEGAGHRWLDRIERIVFAIVMLRAAPHVRQLSRRKSLSEHRCNDASMRRAIMGSKLRRVLRPTDLCQRIEALSNVTIAALVARVLKRLPRGLTRRRPIVAVPDVRTIDLLSAYSATTRCVDSS